MEGAGSATLEERFRIYLGDRQIAEIVRTAEGDRTLYLHADTLGTIGTVSDSLLGSYQQEFEPFGAPAAGGWGTTVTPVTRAGFTGHEHDTDLGLVDMKGRNRQRRPHRRCCATDANLWRSRTLVEMGDLSTPRTNLFRLLFVDCNQ